MQLNVLLITLLLLLSACAIRYTDGQGHENVVGFVWAKYKVGSSPLIVQTRTYGIGVDVGPQSTGVYVGYKEVVRITPYEENTAYRLDYDTGAPFRVLLEEVQPDGSRHE